MKVIPLEIPEVLNIRATSYEDERGIFFESFNLERYWNSGIHARFVQDNVSISKRGTIRGLHWQKDPYPQGKLVSVMKGSVFDVAVDIRFDSPTFGKWVGMELTDILANQLYIPPGFAHGFQALEDNTVFHYKCTNPWHKDSECCISIKDKDINIDWPIGFETLSSKDLAAPTLKEMIRTNIEDLK